VIKHNYEIFKGVEQLDEDFWTKILEYKHANFFQTPRAIDFFKSVKPETFTIGLKRNKKTIALISGVIEKEGSIKSYFSRRAIVYGGPIFVPDITSDEISMLLTALVKEIENKVIYIEIRNFDDYNEYKNAFFKSNFKYVPHLNFHLNITDEETLKKNMSKSKLRDIKRSLKEGAEIIEANNSNQITAYYEILHNLYLTKVKTPLPNEAFFQKLFNDKVAKFLLILYKDEIIGGVVIATLRKNVLYEWFVCGKDQKYKNVFPSILSTWAAIEYANNNNIKYLDFMGAGSPDKDYGVREFKSKFGGELVEHGRFLCITNPTLYWVGKKVLTFIKNRDQLVKIKPKVKSIIKKLKYA